jgi:hypothetical protein
MKRELMCIVFVLTILIVYMGPGAAWAEDTRSRIYQLENRVHDLENETPKIGVWWIGAAEFQRGWHPLLIAGTNFAATCGEEPPYWFPYFGWGPISIPFKSTITQIDFRVFDNSESDIVLGIYQGGPDVPLVFISTNGYQSTERAIFSSGPINLPYDPSDFEYNKPWYIKAEFNECKTFQRIYWVRMYYTIP